MKKFTKILESQNSQKTYEVSVEMKLTIKAENAGEAGYLADSILGSVAEQSDFSIINIEEKSSNEIDLES